MWERMRMLGMKLAVLIFIVTLVVSLFLFAVLSKMLRPLQELNDGAKQIAKSEKPMDEIRQKKGGG